MKYRIEIPIRKCCQKFCWYCFHTEFFKNKKEYERGFTLDQLNLWINKFLFRADEILFLPHGGEPFIDSNIDLIEEMLEYNFTISPKFEFLSNGLSPTNIFEFLKKYKNKIKRIGFSFHRSVITQNEIEQFEETVLFVKSLEIPVYVKELFITDFREEIKKNIIYWKERDVDVRIQDFKGLKGNDFSEYQKYTEEDLALISDEYKHPLNKFCECLEGYKNILIFGFDEMGSDGKICGCWRDQKIVGNITKLEYNPNYFVSRKNGKRVVMGVPENYFTNENDNNCH